MRVASASAKVSEANGKRTEALVIEAFVSCGLARYLARSIEALFEELRTISPAAREDYWRPGRLWPNPRENRVPPAPYPGAAAKWECPDMG